MMIPARRLLALVRRRFHFDACAAAAHLGSYTVIWAPRRSCFVGLAGHTRQQHRHGVCGLAQWITTNVLERLWRSGRQGATQCRVCTRITVHTHTPRVTVTRVLMGRHPELKVYPGDPNERNRCWCSTVTRLVLALVLAWHLCDSRRNSGSAPSAEDFAGFGTLLWRCRARHCRAGCAYSGGCVS